MTEASTSKGSSVKMTPDLANTLRSLHKVYGKGPEALSREYGVARSTVGDVLRRRTYTNLPQGLLSWTGDQLQRHPDAPSTVGCGAVYDPDDATKWCSRGAGHVGNHMWLDPKLAESEQVMWLALDMLAMIDEQAVTEEPCHTPAGNSSDETTSPSAVLTAA